MPIHTVSHEGDGEPFITTANVVPQGPIKYSTEYPTRIVFDVVPPMPPEDADRSPIWVSLDGVWTREDPSGS